MTAERNNPWDSSRPKFRRPPAASSANRISANRSSRSSKPTANNTGDEAVVRDITTGRLLAWHVLQQHDMTDRFLQDLFAATDSLHSLSSQERAAAVDIAAGVVRRRRTIDALIQAQVTREKHQIEPDLWRVLQLGVFQLVFARTPDHAAVDTTVELCRAIDRERWTKFTNGVLRGVGRLLTDQTCASPSPCAVPVSGGEFRLLNSPVFPDPAIDMAGYIADAFSLPTLLAARWVSRFSEKELLAACFHSCDPPQITLRVNRLRAVPQEVAIRLTEKGCVVRPGVYRQSLVVSGTSRIERLPGFDTGDWSIQDEAAMAAAVLLAPRPGERILDICAAPGGKTCHLAELTDDRAHIVACDISDSRLQRVKENAERLQLQSISTQVIGRQGEDVPAGPFDAVLADVPCSNTGVLSRRPEAKWRFQPAELQNLIVMQTRLLLQACERVSVGGRIVYSTCSLEPEENRGVVDAVLRAFPKFQLKKEQLFLPGQPSDGAYQALLIRES